MEDLQKAIDLAITELFGETLQKGALDLAGDASTTADGSVKQAPKGQDDAGRGAGRPKQISDVPDTDTDGKRTGTYDGDVTADQDEDEPDETKQSPVVDQASSKGHLSKAQLAEYESLKKAHEARIVSEQVTTQEKLIKTLVKESIEPLQKAFEAVQARNAELEKLVKAVAKTPQPVKSIVGIEQLQKGTDPSLKGTEPMSKAKLLDAAESLVKAGKVPMEVVIEIENTNQVYNREHKALVEAEALKN